MFRSRAVSLTLVGLFVWATACTTNYKQIEPAEVVDYGEVRVTFTDGERLVLDSAAVADDSIYYWEKVERSPQISKIWVSSPLDQVAVIEVPVIDEPDPPSTGAMVAIVIGGIAAAALAVVLVTDPYLQ